MSKICALLAGMVVISGLAYGEPDDNAGTFIDEIQALIDESRLDAAESRADALRADAEQRDSTIEATAALLMLGRVELRREQYAGAIEHFTACRGYPDAGYFEDCTNRLAEAYWRLGALDEAARYMMELGERYAETGNLDQRYRVWNNLGIIYAEMGDLDQAEDYLLRGLEAVRELDQSGREGASWGNLAKLSHQRGDYHEATERIERAMALAPEHAGIAELGRVFHVRGSIRIDLGDYDAALGDFNTALAYAQQTGSRGEAANARAEMGRTLIKMGNPEQALDVLATALAVTEELGLLRYQHTIHGLMRDAFARMGNDASALAHAEQLMAVHQELLAEEQLREVRRMETLFRVSEAERQAELSASEAELARMQVNRQRAWMTVLVLGIALVLMVMGSLLLRARQRRRFQHESYLRELRFKQDFSAMLVHDLRGPLHGIMLTAGTLQEDTSDPDVRDLSGRIVAYCEGMVSLVNDLLDLSRRESEQLQLDRESGSVASIVERAIESARAQAESKQVRLRTRLEQLDGIEVDAGRLSQVLSNLLDNAIRYSPEGGTVEVGLTRETDHRGNDWQCVTISDQGHGIPEPDLDRIFLPHVRSVRSCDKQGGFGLGLAIARLIVRSHGGEIVARNRESGTGAVLELRLPEKR